MAPFSRTYSPGDDLTENISTTRNMFRWDFNTDTTTWDAETRTWETTSFPSFELVHTATGT